MLRRAMATSRPSTDVKSELRTRDRLERLIIENGLFDQDWYLSENPDVRAYPAGALAHYLRHGHREDRSPHPLFDARWYLHRYPDVADAGVSPLQHFLEKGAREDRDPHPMFWTGYYRANTPEVLRSGVNPLVHFIASWAATKVAASRARVAARSGDDRALDPHPLFDCRWYLARYDTVVAGANPLAHYVRHGQFEDCDPHPLIDAAWYRRAYPSRPTSVPVLEDYLSSSTREVRCPSSLFDRRWYLDSFEDFIDNRFDPLVDYVMGGRVAGRLPHPMFAPDVYERRNIGATAYPGGPLCHFREIGAREGSDPHPLFDTKFYVERYPEAASDPLGPVAHYLLSNPGACLQPHPLFDPRWYRACNPEATEQPVVLLTHLLGYGVWSDRDPSPLFDTTWYLDQYPQSRRDFVHPVVHYLESGLEQGCWPTSFFDPAFYALRYPDCAGNDPLVHFARHGLAAGHATNADALRSWSGTPFPDVYGAGDQRFSGYIRAIGLTARLVLACDAVKKDRESYDHYFACLTANGDRWTIPEKSREKPVISVILPTYNGLHFTIACIESIARFLPQVPFEVIVADNVSTDDTEKVLSARHDIVYLRHYENLGFLRSCNRAARYAKGDYVFLLNNDTLVAPGWLDELYDTFQRFDNVGMAGSKLVYPDGRLQEAGGIIWKDGSAWNYGKFQDPAEPEFNYVRETDYCSGAAIMLTKRLWDEIGGFDEMYVPSYCEDSDLALRVRSLGYSVLYSPLSIIAHFEGMTQGRDTSSGVKSYQVSNTDKLLARWKDMIGAYQPNGEDVNLAKDRGFKKRALFLDNCTPAPKEDAGSVTALNFMLLLRSRGYQVTFIPRDNFLYMDEISKDIQREGIEVVYGHYVNTVSDHLANFGSRYDVIVMMRPDSFLHHIDDIETLAPRAKLIYHTCDLHYLRFEREAQLTGNTQRRVEAAELKELEYKAIARADASIVHSTYEAQVIENERPGLDKVHVFGWAIPVPGAARSFSGRAGAVFVGGFNHGPNLDAVLFFVNDVLPLIWRSLPNFEFHIVGSKTPKEILDLAGPRIIVHGFVENLDPLLQKCRIAVAPLRFGAGIKGKIATAMSVGLPNVITTVSAEGMGMIDGKDCLIADTPADFAAAVCRLNNDETLWAQISHASEVFAENNYGTTAATKIFDGILKGAGEVPEVHDSVRLVGPTGAPRVGAWPAPLRPVGSVGDAEQWRTFQTSVAADRMKRRDRYARIKMHDQPELGFPGYDAVIGGRARFVVSGVELSERHNSLRRTLVCPVSGLNNQDRLLATLARQWVASHSKARVAILSESSALRRWAEAEGFAPNPEDGKLDILLTDVADVAKGELTASHILTLQPTMASALARVAEITSGSQAEAVVDIYHSPEFGHLGNDLFVLREFLPI